MGQILAVVSSKGGVGKTTTAVNISAAFASLDFPTCLVEADPQCSLVATFGFDRFDVPRGLAETAKDGTTALETTFETPVPGLHMISSNVWSHEEEGHYLDALRSDPQTLKRGLASLRDRYDYVVIDAPPMLGPITVAVLAAADRFVVPLQTEPHAVRALGRLLEMASEVRARHNPSLIFDGIILTMIDLRTRLSADVIRQIRTAYPEHVFDTGIPRSVRLAEIPASGRPVVTAAPASRGARSYLGLAEEILLKHARERAEERAEALGGDDGEGADESDLTLSPVSEAPAPKEPLNGNGPAPAEGPLAPDEWDDRFVDLENYLDMESEGGAKTATAEDEWEEEWGSRD